MKLLLSPHTDPVINLATESYLRACAEDDYLAVYVNDPCVVIGRNQSAGAEADLGFCRERGIRVIRRISGGGAVYHDHGNVNYSFIRSGGSSLADGKEDLRTVVEILGRMGLTVTTGQRSELLAGGLKISGTASFCRGGRYIFHGTLLFDSDLPTLEKALCGDKAARGRRIPSVPSPVTNIRDRLPGYSEAAGFAREFIRVAAQVTGGTVIAMPDAEPNLADHLPEVIL